MNCIEFGSAESRRIVMQDNWFALFDSLTPPDKSVVALNLGDEAFIYDREKQRTMKIGWRRKHEPVEVR